VAEVRVVEARVERVFVATGVEEREAPADDGAPETDLARRAGAPSEANAWLIGDDEEASSSSNRARKPAACLSQVGGRDLA